MALWRLWRSRQNTLGRTGFADVVTLQKREKVPLCPPYIRKIQKCLISLDVA